MSWTDRAACIGKPVEWFMAERGSRKDFRAPIERRALTICAGCPVMEECLNYAIDNEQFVFSVRGNGEEPEEVRHWLEGIFGGTTFEDRKATRDMDRDSRLIELKARSRARALQLGLMTKGEVA